MAWMEQLQATNGGQATVCAAGAYVLGCFATGYYLVRARTGRDIREIESGNIGARNVSCVLGRTGFFLTVLGDVAKGILAVEWFNPSTAVATNGRTLEGGAKRTLKSPFEGDAVLYIVEDQDKQ